MAKAADVQVVFDFATAKKSAAEIAKLERDAGKLAGELASAKNALEQTDEWAEVARVKEEVAKLDAEISEAKRLLIDGLASAGK